MANLRHKAICPSLGNNRSTNVVRENRKREMHLVYALEDLPDPCQASIFLAGPMPRDPGTPSWRPSALSILQDLGYTGAVVIPEPRGAQWRHSFVSQANWEVAMRMRADLVAFWVPRELAAMPAFTTNVEFGEDYDNCRCLFGRPAGAPKCRYLDVRWEAMTGRPPHDSLRDVLAEAVTLLGEGVDRFGAERDVPLTLWRSRPFNEWYQAQKKAGHALRKFQVRHVLADGMRHPTSTVTGFLAWAKVDVAGEDQTSAKHFFLARPDTIAVVPMFDAGGQALEAFFARKHRLESRNSSGFVVEAFSGESGESGPAAQAVAVKDLSKVLRLTIDPSRLISLGSRPYSAMAASQHAQLFALALTVEEATLLRRFAADNLLLGDDGSDRVRLVRQPLGEPLDCSLDWASIGMLLAAAKAVGKWCQSNEGN